ncbi:MAG: NUDIX domain-containing protein [Patescibacteria group bacterium]|jgi:ADP-ribose pyrophosphatase YjhB (NUDIX family)
MNILLEITEKDLGIDGSERYDKPYLLRKTARAVLLREDGMIALQHMSNLGYYKLPGGGLDPDENIKDALYREIKEEVGCDIEITNELGVTIEYRNYIDLLQISYCYLAKVAGNINQPELTKEEIEEGLIPMWVSFDEAIRLLQLGSTHNDGKFITTRDLAVLLEARRHLR